MQFVPIGVVAAWFAFAGTARAAAEGEWCGQVWGWRASCDEGLECDVDWTIGRWSSGHCVADECQSDADCPHGYCELGATCAGLDCPPPPPSRCTECGDGSQLRCRRAELPCPEGQLREIVDGCFGSCVDRRSCEVASCEYDGRTYPVGSSFPANDGCNTCNCSEDGSALCTLALCTCDYDQPNVSWVSRDPEECKLIDYRCAEGTQPFTNGCGCGCEPQRPCRVAGCSGQLCVPLDDDGISTCEWTAAYACYADATCELQPDGACGWTPSEELRACLDAAAQEP
jgi:hypothetical protein